MSISQASAESFSASKPRAHRDRYFYSIASFILLAFLVAGFQRFFLEGKGFDGGAIPKPLLAFVIAHGMSLTLWVMLFFAQSVLIASKNRQIHMKLGYGAAVVGCLVVITGPTMAYTSVRFRGEFPIFGMTYSQFLLPMLSEMLAFGVFVALGMRFRKSNLAAHRAMMLLATLAVISGATARTTFVGKIYNMDSWVGLYGPVFTLGVLFLAARAVLIRKLDRPLAKGLAALMAFYLVGVWLAKTSGWAAIAAIIMRK